MKATIQSESYWKFVLGHRVHLVLATKDQQRGLTRRLRDIM